MGYSSDGSDQAKDVRGISCTDITKKTQENHKNYTDNQGRLFSRTMSPGSELGRFKNFVLGIYFHNTGDVILRKIYFQSLLSSEQEEIYCAIMRT